jgi:predicted dehydrogenase
VKIARGREAEYVDAPVPEELIGAPVPAGVHGPLFATVDRFLRAVLDGEAMWPSFEDGDRLQEIIESILVSSEEGRRVPIRMATRPATPAM